MELLLVSVSIVEYLTSYSGNRDAKGWLKHYESATKLEKWSTSQMLECINLKVKKKAKDWFSNLIKEAKPKTWKQFLTLFHQKYSIEDHENTIPKLYLSRQRKGKNFNIYFTK